MVSETGRGRIVRISLALAMAFSALAFAPGGAAAAFTLRVPVLMYHHVLPPSLVPAGERYPGLYVDPATFDAQLAALHANGWHTVTARDLAQALAAGRRLPPRTFVITFDDGRPDQFRYAFPILQKYGFVATFFVVPGRIGTTRHMTASQLQALAAAGNEIANHTLDHRPLTTLTYDAMRAQIRLASDAIQAITGSRPITLAYPYGAHNALAESAASAEGIYLAFTTVPGAAESLLDRLAAPRIRVVGVHHGPGGALVGGTTASRLLDLVSAASGTPLTTTIVPSPPGQPGQPARTKAPWLPTAAAPVALAPLPSAMAAGGAAAPIAGQVGVAAPPFLALGVGVAMGAIALGLWWRRRELRNRPGRGGR